MWLQRTLLGLVLGAMAALAAVAQAQGVIRWQSATDHGTGLQPPDLQLNLGVGYEGVSPMEHWMARPESQGLNLKLVGRTSFLSELGVYGRVGMASSNTTAPGFAPDGGHSYGVGVSWDLSPRASASLGWDSYDFRSPRSDSQLRATSLGLQWRY